MSAPARLFRALTFAMLGIPWFAAAQPQAMIAGTDNINRMSEAAMIALREKAWSLFDEVRTANLPQTGSWIISSQAYSSRGCNVPPAPQPWQATAAAEHAWLDAYAPLKATAEKRRPLLEIVFFNREACLDIQNSDFPLYEKETTRKLARLQRREIAEFRPGAEVLKTFWRPLPKDNSPIQVGVWRWPTQKTIDRDNSSSAVWLLEPRPEHEWGDQVCVQLNPPSGSACLKAEDFFPMAYCAKDYCTGMEDRQPLILLAVHAISKQSADWLWATFWWKGTSRTSGSSWTCDDAQRGHVEGAWANFSANVTASFKLARPAIRNSEIATCGVPGTIGSSQHKEEYLATYNPYVEGVMPNDGRKSSCIACHARANTRGDLGLERFRIPPVGTVEWPPVTDFEGHIRTDYLWSVREHIGPTREPE